MRGFFFFFFFFIDFFRWWQQHFEFQPVRVAVEGRSNAVQNTHVRLLWRDFLAYCTSPVSVHLVMVCVGCSFRFFFYFNLFAQFETTKSHENSVFLYPFSSRAISPQSNGGGGGGGGEERKTKQTTTKNKQQKNCILYRWTVWFVRYGEPCVSLESTTFLNRFWVPVSSFAQTIWLNYLWWHDYHNKNNETKSYVSILKYNFFIPTDGLTELLLMTWLRW